MSENYPKWVFATADSSFITVTFSGNLTTCTAGCNITIAVQPPTRRLLVPIPTRWGKKTRMAWVDLINNKTKTGWVVEMI